MVNHLPAADGADPGGGGLVAAERPGDNAPPLSVSELAGALRRTVEDRFGHVRVRGEISGYKRAASGHVYMTLKDDSACLDAVMWKGGAARLAFVPEDGIEVIATGRLTTYPGRSRYQIIVEALELAGEGALMLLFEKLRQRLAGEGLFSRPKRDLPFVPRVIGIVTSPTGAVIRDMIHRLSDRFPVHVLLWPVPVQGEGAAARIAEAIAGFGAMPADGPVPRPDVLIVARGGGSIEDLWAFNEEVVVRAVATSPIPVISAVGHETDTTLTDHAADHRAPTPTAAAERAVPVHADLIQRVGEGALRLAGAARRGHALAGERLAATSRALPRLTDLARPQAQRLDEAWERLGHRARAVADRASADLARDAGALRPAMLARQADLAASRLDALGRTLVQLDPAAPLTRGYAMVMDAAGAIVRDRAAAEAAGAVMIRFADGAVPAQVGGHASPTPARRARPAGDVADKQQRLL